MTFSNTYLCVNLISEVAVIMISELAKNCIDNDTIEFRNGDRMVDASEYRNTPISFAEAARILGIKTETLEGYVEQGLIKRMICEARVGKIDRHVSLCDILTIRGGKKALRRLSRAITTGAKHGRAE